MSCESGIDFSEAFPRISGVVVEAFDFGEFAVKPFVSCVYFGLSRIWRLVAAMILFSLQR
jgi:hypothetical protein